MRRIILWVILGGITLIAGVIVFQLLGTYWYLKSPARVVNGAFTRLLDAKSFNLNLQAEDDAKNGTSFNVSGPINKQVLTAPVADLKFSFQAQGQTFYGNGQAQAKDGNIYLRFDQIAGIPNVLPGALQSIWAGLDVNTLLAVGHDRFFPEAAGGFTEADLQAIVAIARRHIPFSPIGSGGTPIFIDNVLTTPYKIVLDRSAMLALFSEIKAAVKGSSLDDDEKATLAKIVADLPPISGEIWVSREDGTLREALLVTKGAASSFHLDLRFSDYNKTVSVVTPVDHQPLIELIRRLAGTSLSGVKVQLPFDIPVPILNVDMGVPTVPVATGSNGTGKAAGELPNLIKLFYGTDQPFVGK
jgi:hypothetical protein